MSAVTATCPGSQAAAATGVAPAPATAAGAALRRGRVASQAALLAGATLGARMVGLAGSLTVASLLGPVGLGAWSTLRVLAGYGNLNHLGALEAYRREIPRLRGSGNEAEMAAVESAAHAFAARSAFSLAAAGVAIVLLARWRSPGSVLAAWAPAALLLAATVVPVTLGTCWTETLGVRHRFGVLARLRLVRGLAYALLITGGAWLAGVTGAMAGLALAECLLYLLTRRAALACGPVARARHDPRRARRLVAIGFPITLLWWIVLVQESVDRIVCSSVLGAEAGGHYALGALLASVVFLLPEALSRVLHPRLNEAASAADGIAAVEARVLGAARRIAWAFPPLAGAAAFLLAPFVARLLPRYVPGLPAASLLLGASALAALIPCGIDRLVAGGRERGFLLLGPVSLLANIGLCVLGAWAGHGPWGVAAGAVASNLVLAALLWSRPLQARGVRARLPGLALLLPPLVGLGWQQVVTAALSALPGAGDVASIGWALVAASAYLVTLPLLFLLLPTISRPMRADLRRVLGHARASLPPTAFRACPGKVRTRLGSRRRRLVAA